MMSDEENSRELGFTLLEVLVALAVLAIGAVSLLTATQTHASRISAIETRTIARWVADNQLTTLRLGLEPDATVSAMGRDWTTTVTRTGTNDPDLERVDISVALAADGRTMFQLAGFIDTVGIEGTPE